MLKTYIGIEKARYKEMHRNLIQRTSLKSSYQMSKCGKLVIIPYYVRVFSMWKIESSLCDGRVSKVTTILVQKNHPQSYYRITVGDIRIIDIPHVY